MEPIIEPAGGFVNRGMRALHSLEQATEVLRSTGLSRTDYHGETQRATLQPGEAGGDFFDFVPLGDSLAVYLGNVSGHGEGAAILRSGLQAALRVYANRIGNKLPATLRALNGILCDLSPNDYCATLFYASIDLSRRELCYVNAGQDAALLVRATPYRVRRLENSGAILGLTSRTEFRQRTVPLEAGDLLVSFSGGICEAADGQGRQFCEQRVLAAISQFPDAHPRELVHRILDEVERFSEATPLSSDRTVTMLRFKGAGSGAFADSASERELSFAAA